jgi:hypothetical protein
MADRIPRIGSRLRGDDISFRHAHPLRPRHPPGGDHARIGGVRTPPAAGRGGADESRAELNQVHDLLTDATLVCIVLHVIGVAFRSWRQRENLVAAMISGRKRDP